MLFCHSWIIHSPVTCISMLILFDHEMNKVFSDYNYCGNYCINNEYENMRYFIYVFLDML